MSPSPALIAWNAIRVVCSERRSSASIVVPEVVEPEQDRHHAAHVETLLAAG